MANPVFVDCTKNSWELVAEDVKQGVINIVRDDIAYLQTYKLTGEAAPTAKSDGVRVYDPENANLKDYQIIISATANIDVYLWAENHDGRIRADI